MDVTTELRWFGRGGVAAAAERWFGGKPLPIRTDHYLAAASTAGLGLKVRAEAMLELKAPNGEVAVWSFGERVSGRAGTWAKWALPLGPRWDEVALGQGWLRVEKRRRIRRFGVDPGPTGAGAREVGSEDPLELGVDVELTDLVARDTSWWTLAFEAFGDPGRQRDALRAAAGAVLASPPEELSLIEARSTAYPAWLAALDGGPSRT
jgi:hypothetical protein